jgi:hypothetical protein
MHYMHMQSIPDIEDIPQTDTFLCECILYGMTLNLYVLTTGGK